MSLQTESAKAAALSVASPASRLLTPCVLLQIEGAKATSEQTTGSREEQDELELPNFRKHARGGGLPLLGQVCLTMSAIEFLDIYSTLAPRGQWRRFPVKHQFLQHVLWVQRARQAPGLRDTLKGFGYGHAQGGQQACMTTTQPALLTERGCAVTFYGAAHAGMLHMTQTRLPAEQACCLQGQQVVGLSEVVAHRHRVHEGRSMSDRACVLSAEAAAGGH